MSEPEGAAPPGPRRDATWEEGALNAPGGERETQL